MILRHDVAKVLAQVHPGIEYCLHGAEIKPLKSELVIKPSGKTKLAKEGLEIISNHPHPTDEQIEAAQVELDKLAYVSKRDLEYRSCGHSLNTCMEAFIEKEEGNPAKWNKIMIERKAIQVKYPKGA